MIKYLTTAQEEEEKDPLRNPPRRILDGLHRHEIQARPDADPRHPDLGQLRRRQRVRSVPELHRHPAPELPDERLDLRRPNPPPGAAPKKHRRRPGLQVRPPAPHRFLQRRFIVVDAVRLEPEHVAPRVEHKVGAPGGPRRRQRPPQPDDLRFESVERAVDAAAEPGRGDAVFDVGADGPEPDRRRDHVPNVLAVAVLQVDGEGQAGGRGGGRDPGDGGHVLLEGEVLVPDAQGRRDGPGRGGDGRDGRGLGRVEGPDGVEGGEVPDVGEDDGRRGRVKPLQLLGKDVAHGGGLSIFYGRGLLQRRYSSILLLNNDNGRLYKPLNGRTSLIMTKLLSPAESALPGPPPRTRPLDNPHAALDGVDDDEAALEVGVVAPGARVVVGAAARLAVVLRVDVKVGDLPDARGRRVPADGRDVEHAQARAVVALVREPAVDELVVVDAADGALEEARLPRPLQRPDVPEVRHGEPVGRRARLVALVDLVVQHEEVLPVGVEDPALNEARGDACPDSHRQGVLVVPVADVAAPVLHVGPTVHNALGVVDVAVAGGAPQVQGVRDVGEVEELQARVAGQVAARLGADGHGVAPLLVDDDVVAAAERQRLGPVRRQVPLVGEDDGVPGVDGEELSSSCPS
ncbi:hypothetical protein CTA1_11976 [Colletotrichum tanaceti]|uniref:Uncharacterized protein n=1 Tax=Colletotrichum tanaceti TaxID=1306861 RepID=A0A4U6XHF7_9PEZI|nr:hypothetical protein CTA1_11976 [Colletotrichum tanaceti]